MLRRQRAELVRHEREQRRDHEGELRREQGGQLVGEALPGARRQGGLEE